MSIQNTLRVFAIALTLSPAARGLNPDRTLTQYLHRIWQMQQGLPQGTIQSILQTHDGYLWLGTQTGLVRFDGVRFLTVSDLWIRALAEDSQYNLWAGTNDGGLLRIRDGVLTRFAEPQGLSSPSVPCVLQDRRGDLWACTADGMARARLGSNNSPQFETYRTRQGLAANNVRAACEAGDGSLWLGGDSVRLSVWNGLTFSTQPIASAKGYTSVRAMLCDTDGSLWIGTTNGLIHRKNGRERIFTVKDGLPDNWILCLTQSPGGLWIGTKEGFSRWRNGEMESFRTRDGLSQSAVYSIAEDREGALWVGTKHGLNQFVDGRSTPYTVSEGLPSNDSGPVLEDGKGEIWAGTLGAGLTRFDGKRFTTLRRKDGLASDSIYALSEDSEGDLWVGTDLGLNRLRNGRVDAEYTTGDGLPANSIRCLFRDSRGVLWIGTAAGVATYRDGKFARPPGFHLAVPILALAEDGQGRIVAATPGGGLHSYSDGKLEELTPSELPPRDVASFYKDRDGLLWMGTIGSGLRLLKGGKIVSFYVHNGLFDDEIFGIAADDQDQLWMACSKGIFSVHRQDLLQFAAGSIHGFESTPYIPTDALRTIECQSGVEPAVSRMRDGRLWFSTIRGLIVLDPARMQRKLQPPQVVIEDITVNGESQKAAEIARLTPGRKNLEFRYTGLSYVSPTRISFRYILEGYDKKWIEAGTRREAFYTNLPPGKFRFLVTACNVDGTCGSAPGSVAFLLAPHVYQEPWFLPVCVALAAFTAWGMYQLRIRRLQDRFGMILAERSRIARELHDTLIQGFSGVTMEMQAMLGRLKTVDDRGKLQEIIQDAGNCLAEARRSVTGLRTAPAAGKQTGSGLTAAIAQTARQLTEARDVRLKLKLEESPAGLEPDVEYNLLRIVQEALANSVKHSGARNIEVALQRTAEAFRLQVKDDGDGFADQENTTKVGHYGLIGMRERATHIGADFRLASEPGQGTTVSVLVPARRNGEAK